MVEETGRSTVGHDSGLMTRSTCTVGEAVIGLLEKLGVECVFGIPGVHTIELYRGLAASGIAAVTARHEQGAGFMADGYARVTGRPGVCVLISGPGVTNAATPIAQAYHDSIPLLVIASTSSRSDPNKPHASLHDLPDQTELLRTITGYSRTVREATELPAELALAWSVLRSGRPRPVHLAIPADLLPQDGGNPVPLETSWSRQSGESSLVARAAATLSSAKRPAILLGGGCVDAGSEAVALAEAIDAPIVLTGNAKGTVSSDHPLCLGATLPLRPVLDLLYDADVVLLVGTELSEVDTIYSGWPIRFAGAVVRIDIDAGQLAAQPSTISIHGDAADVMAALCSALAVRRRPRRPGPGQSRVSVARAGFRWTAQTEGHRPWLDAIDAAVPSDRVVVLDSTQLAYSAHHYLPARSPRGWIAPFGYGTLGNALPMAIGAKLGSPERPVIALTGDGGVLFTIAELATAVDLGITLPVVLWDNAGYAEIRDAFDRANAKRIGTETTSRDIEMIARGFGAEACSARNPHELADALGWALGRSGPTLIRVPEPRAPPSRRRATAPGW